MTERVAARVMTLPTGPAISLEEVDAVCDLIRLVVAHAADLADRFRTARPHG